MGGSAKEHTAFEEKAAIAAVVDGPIDLGILHE
jgi:hypothetical protein